MYNLPFDEFSSPMAMAFYEEYKYTSLSKLLLKFSQDALRKDLSLQLESRRRAAGKLPSWLNADGIVFPPKLNLEQASSEVTAAYKTSIVEFDSSLDLTAGTGIDSWQFAKRAKSHTSVESNPELIALTKHNFEKLGIANTSFIAKNAEDFVAENNKHFDVIYIDPSRRKEDGSKAVALEKYSPNAMAMQDELLTMCNYLLIKVSPFADISYLLSCFPKKVQEVHVVAVSNECKEILLLLSQTETENSLVKTINFSTDFDEVFAFSSNAENDKAELTEEVEKYVFEPNAAVLKAGAFNALGKAFNLKKLHQHSHIYTGAFLLKDFPGKTYEVTEVAAAYKLKGTYQKVSIATRNFPDKPESIRKRLKLTDGNDYRLVATTIGKNKVFIIGTLVNDNQNALQNK